MYYNKSSNINEKFPKFKKELISMVERDQKEIRENSHAYSQIKSESIKNRKYTLIAKKCHARAHRMLEILDEIKEPTIENVGTKGSEAVLLLAQHSYLEIMKKVLNIFEKHFKEDPSKIHYGRILSLKDRILTLEHKKQLYGTQWMADKYGNPFLIAVEDFANVNKRRAIYGLGPVKRPINLAIGAVKYPLGKGLAKESDQKKLTKEEYEEYSCLHLKSLI